jgi:hypothetical protein
MKTALLPFEESLGVLSVSADAGLRQGVLHLSYEVLGDVERIDCQTVRRPMRRDELWRGTCFEAFLPEGEGPAYWEVNLAPSGDWNVYRFTDYRKQMSQPEVEAPRIRLDRGLGFLRLEATWSLPKLGLERRYRSAGLTAVIQNGERIEYWALAHKNPQPDFHRAESFVFKLDSTGSE